MSDTILTVEQVDAIAARAEAATPGPWRVWDGPSFVGGGHDLCIGAGDDWLANMDHRYGDNYLERLKHETESGHSTLDAWPPDCQICSFSEEVDQEQARNAEFIARAREDIPRLVATIRALRNGS